MTTQSAVVAGLVAAAVLGPTAVSAQHDPPAVVLEDCKSRITKTDYETAIVVCSEALRIDPNLADAYFYRGYAYQQLAAEPVVAPPAEAPPPDPLRPERRAKAVADYKRHLAMNAGDTDDRRLNRRFAMSGLVQVLSQMDDKDASALGYADTLSRLPSVTYADLVALASLYGRYGRPDSADQAFRALMSMRDRGTDPMTRRLQELTGTAPPSDGDICYALALFYTRPYWNGRTRFDDALTTLDQCAAVAPRDFDIHQRLATLLWDKAYRDPSLTDAQKVAYAQRGLASVDKALALKPDSIESLIYKALLIRIKAAAATDPAESRHLLEEAQALQRRAMELKRAAAPAPPPPPPPRPAGSGPLRVGGQIKEPKKLTDVRPVYPEVAKQARVQGVVILECTISPEGRVTDTRVLRGVPLLDGAAIDAVRQWTYAPTLMNGVPVPVLMTVTVNFALQ
jgi:protein TonB